MLCSLLIHILMHSFTCLIFFSIIHQFLQCFSLYGESFVFFINSVIAVVAFVVIDIVFIAIIIILIVFFLSTVIAFSDFSSVPYSLRYSFSLPFLPLSLSSRFLFSSTKIFILFSSTNISKHRRKQT